MMKTIFLGGGCFWCIEAVFQQIKGVVKVTSGYAGGTFDNPTYEEICLGITGHAEVVKIEYVNNLISLEKLLEIFFEAHDPTTLDRQGNDIGSQYRSIILYAEEEQKKEIEDYILKLTLDMHYPNPIVTEVKIIDKFYRAEEYHQNYYQKNKNKAYCRAVIAPKLEKINKTFIL
ncbi:MAG: peptide-methionine (S)-S-oxide reductase MsrA [Candidatus Heimdallarchaeum endolithica]|uniref:Peptide methionine sulfoxide reductase MsrA n=1 Tax=Candidatus Heimdallarchaeum endolithica TaxID=2876572 RepID=A0A9Y1BRW3_9ARCH|nr:MAG: peptide-methionine (S)-S-oxide reductase MsrA [Candidatus Heimdallarchaeum endolithica]